MAKGKGLDTRDLFPETPEGIVKEAPTLQTIGDLNLSQFFERRSDEVVVLNPQVIKLFPQLLPLLEQVALGVRNILSAQHEIADNDPDKDNLANYVDVLVRNLNERIPAKIENIILREEYSGMLNFLKLIENSEFSSEDKFREFIAKALHIAIKMGVVQGLRKLAAACNVNAGQLSNFIRGKGPMSKDKFVACLEYAASQANEVDRLDELKSLIEEQ